MPLQVNENKQHYYHITWELIDHRSVEVELVREQAIHCLLFHVLKFSFPNYVGHKKNIKSKACDSLVSFSFTGKIPTIKY